MAWLVKVNRRCNGKVRHADAGLHLAWRGTSRRGMLRFRSRQLIWKVGVRLSKAGQSISGQMNTHGRPRKAEIGKFRKVRLMPKISHGECIRKGCVTITDLADGLCVKCWDCTADKVARK